MAMGYAGKLFHDMAPALNVLPKDGQMYAMQGSSVRKVTIEALGTQRGNRSVDGTEG